MPIRRAPPTTITDVAKRAKVSISTVSRVINRNVPVSEEVLARVEAAMTQLKFVPHTAARNLATRQTSTLGLLLADIGGSFLAPMLSGIDAIAGQADYNLLISTAGDARGSDVPRSIGAHNTDGLLIFADSMSEAGLSHYHELGFPMVLIHRTPPPALNIPCVTVENKAASRKLIDHLIEVHQRRHIVFLRGPEGQEDSYWRETGYREALAAHQLPIDPSLIAPGQFDRTIARATVGQLLERGVKMDAIFSGDDESAIGVLEALRAADRRVPDEIAVVGFDDEQLAAYLNPPLTTVRAPTEEVGREATRQLLQIIRTGKAEALTLLPTEMIIRRSCGCHA